MGKAFTIIARAVPLLLIGVVCGCQMQTYGNNGSLVKGSGWNGAGAAGVSISSYTFDPSPLSFPMASNVTVTWTNNQDVTHTVTSDTGLFDSGNVVPGATFSFNFTGLAAGTYGYHCKIHSGMTGKISVN